MPWVPQGVQAPARRKLIQLAGSGGRQRTGSAHLVQGVSACHRQGKGSEGLKVTHGEHMAVLPKVSRHRVLRNSS